MKDLGKEIESALTTTFWCGVVFGLAVVLGAYNLIQIILAFS